MILDPTFVDRLLVQPEPTEESWQRVRELLQRQDRIFRCGLGLDATDMEARLRSLLRQGFRFRLPDSILRPIRLPGGAVESVAVRGHSARVAASTVDLGLDPAWLWYGLEFTFRAGP